MPTDRSHIWSKWKIQIRLADPLTYFPLGELIPLPDNASLCNAFRPPLVKSTDSDKVIARRMVALAKSPNKLQDKVMKTGWDKKRVTWKKIDDTKLDNFPELTELTQGPDNGNIPT